MTAEVAGSSPVTYLNKNKNSMSETNSDNYFTTLPSPKQLLDEKSEYNKRRRRTAIKSLTDSIQYSIETAKNEHVYIDLDMMTYDYLTKPDIKNLVTKLNQAGYVSKHVNLNWFIYIIRDIFNLVTGRSINYPKKYIHIDLQRSLELSNTSSNGKPQ